MPGQRPVLTPTEKIKVKIKFIFHFLTFNQPKMKKLNFQKPAFGLTFELKRAYLAVPWPLRQPLTSFLTI